MSSLTGFLISALGIAFGLCFGYLIFRGIVWLVDLEKDDGRDDVYGRGYEEDV